MKRPSSESVREGVSDLVLLAGGAAVVVGVAEFSQGAAWIVGGVLAMAFGWILGAEST